MASKSPRRSELLQTAGIPFALVEAETDESCEGTPEERVMELSLRKAKAGLAALGNKKDALVLGADTLVARDGQVLGKPADPREAQNMLRMLSDGWHDVFTGITLLDGTGKVQTRAVRTRVHMMPLSDEDIQNYVATGEPLDKAGAYGIQGGACVFIDEIQGQYSNVVGLPVADVWRLWKQWDKV